jgi:hypothetical protein
MTTCPDGIGVSDGEIAMLVAADTDDRERHTDRGHCG